MDREKIRIWITKQDLEEMLKEVKEDNCHVIGDFSWYPGSKGNNGHRIKGVMMKEVLIKGLENRINELKTEIGDIPDEAFQALWG